jgi:hypothetical protein
MESLTIAHGTNETEAISGSNDRCRAVSKSPASAPTPEAERSPQSLALDRIGEEIAELSANLQAEEYRFLRLLGEFDAGGGFRYQGVRSCAQWLSWRTGLNSGAAREKVRVARALPKLPRIGEALRLGALSYSKVRALTRIATAETEERLLRIALQATASQVERMVGAWRKANPSEEEKAAASRRKAIQFSLSEDDDGTWVVRGRLAPEVGSFLMTALREAGASLDDEREEGVSAETSSAAGRTVEEALKLIVESALTAGLAPVVTGEEVLVQASSASETLEPSAGVSAETPPLTTTDAEYRDEALEKVTEGALAGETSAMEANSGVSVRSSPPSEKDSSALTAGLAANGFLEARWRRRFFLPQNGDERLAVRKPESHLSDGAHPAAKPRCSRFDGRSHA